MDLTTPAQRQATTAADELAAVLGEAGYPLPSLAADWPSITGDVLVTLGRARPDVVAGIASLLRDGLTARAQQQG
ncbi:hypothetical protein GCM10009665_62010 [Kitasatospora nipponensis]|uniref:Uncharacterized protein n=1 Tax=Kitasatospora nipponensis TaxID=258049 RepID=A0ABP4HJR7_9ACTN